MLSMGKSSLLRLGQYVWEMTEAMSTEDTHGNEGSLYSQMVAGSRGHVSVMLE